MELKEPEKEKLKLPWEKVKTCTHMMREHNVEDMAIVLCRNCFDHEHEGARNEGRREAFDELLEVLTKRGVLNVGRNEVIKMLGYSN